MNILDSILQWVKDDRLEEDRVYAPYMRLWGIIGLWPTKNSNHQIFRYFYPRFGITTSTLFFFLCIYNLFKGTQSVTNTVLQVFIMFFTLFTITKISTYLLQQKKLEDLCDDLENIHEGQRLAGIPDVTSKLRDIQFISKFFCFYVTIPCQGIEIILAPIVFVSALLERKHMSSLRYPCDAEFSPCFESIVTLEIILIVVNVHLMGFCDIFFADILSQVWGEFKILNYNLQNIREFAVKKVSEEFGEEEKTGCSHDLVEVLSEPCETKSSLDLVEVLSEPLEELRVVGDVAVNSRRVMPRFRGSNAKWRWVSTLWEGRCGQEIEDRRLKGKREVAKKLAIDWAMKQRLADCIRHHQALISIGGAFESIFNPFLMNQIGISLAGVVAVALYIMLVEKWGILQFCTMICELFLILELLIFSWLVDQIAQESSNVKTAIYSCDWFEATESFKRSMRVIISRSNDPVVIRAGGFVPISMETFATVMNKAYSYLMTMKTALKTK